MADTIRNLWPQDIRADILPPLAILKAQIAPLSQITGGLLRAVLSTRTETIDSADQQFAGESHFKLEDSLVESPTRVYHDLSVSAPSLDGRPYHLLTLHYRRDRYYPAILSSHLNHEGEKSTTEEEFVESLRTVLQSSSTRPLINSLLARIHDRANGL